MLLQQCPAVAALAGRCAPTLLECVRSALYSQSAPKRMASEQPGAPPANQPAHTPTPRPWPLAPCCRADAPHKSFASLAALKSFLHKQHKLQFCDICLEGRKVRVGGGWGGVG